MQISIHDLSETDETSIQAAAQILYEAFREKWPDAWPSLEESEQEVREALEPEKICRTACTADGTVLGWIGGIPAYGGEDLYTTWELHPLAVRPDYQRQGIGTALLADLEEQIRARGGMTIFLGSDDETGLTSLSDVDLYENTWDHLRNIQNLKGHPYTFYQRHGYQIVGVIPDANGIGKPDIIMAKRIV